MEFRLGVFLIVLGGFHGVFAGDESIGARQAEAIRKALDAGLAKQNQVMGGEESWLIVREEESWLKQSVTVYNPVVTNNYYFNMTLDAFKEAHDPAENTILEVKLVNGKILAERFIHFLMCYEKNPNRFIKEQRQVKPKILFLLEKLSALIPECEVQLLNQLSGVIGDLTNSPTIEGLFIGDELKEFEIVLTTEVQKLKQERKDQPEIQPDEGIMDGQEVENVPKRVVGKLMGETVDKSSEGAQLAEVGAVSSRDTARVTSDSVPKELAQNRQGGSQNQLTFDSKESQGADGSTSSQAPVVADSESAARPNTDASRDKSPDDNDRLSATKFSTAPNPFFKRTTSAPDLLRGQARGHLFNDALQDESPDDNDRSSVTGVPVSPYTSSKSSSDILSTLRTVAPELMPAVAGAAALVSSFSTRSTDSDESDSENLSVNQRLRQDVEGSRLELKKSRTGWANLLVMVGLMALPFAWWGFMNREAGFRRGYRAHERGEKWVLPEASPPRRLN